MRYAFGDGERAARRLALVARVFEPTSRALLRECAGSPRVAVDLGCGPGHTTALVADATEAAEVHGLDASRAHLGEARRLHSDPRLRFHEHDATCVPFPCGPADLVYCRYLLTHLAEPARALERWATQLRPGGRLLVDEVEWIRVASPALAQYLEIVEALLADQGHCLYVGPRLAALPAPAGVARVHAEVRELEVPVARAAEMFALNLTVWRDHPFVRAKLAPAALDRLAAALADPADPDAVATWGLRQLAFTS